MSAPSRSAAVQEAREEGKVFHEGKWVQGTKRGSKSKEAESRKHKLARMIKSPTFEQKRSIAKHVDKQDKRGNLPHIKKLSLSKRMTGESRVLEHMKNRKEGGTFKGGALGKADSRMKYG